MWCQVEVWGNWLPTMQWSITDGNLLTTEINETVVNRTIVLSVLQISVESIVAKGRHVQFMCETFFLPRNQYYEIPGTRAAKNVPEYRHTWTSPKLILHPDWTTGLFVLMWTICSE